MKRRVFLQAPLAAAGLAIVPTAFAAGLIGRATVTSAELSLLRLDEPATAEASAFPRWRFADASFAPSARACRISVHGFERAPASALARVEVDAVFAAGAHRHKLYAHTPEVCGKPVGFDAAAGGFSGFVVTRESTASSCSRSDTCDVAPAFGGGVTPGVYALALAPRGSLDLNRLVFTGVRNKPLGDRSGDALAFDYLAFTVAEAG